MSASDQPQGDPQDLRTALTHVRSGEHGDEARMVDVGAKGVSARSALARAVVELPAGVGELLAQGGGPKGPVAEVARVAGILGAKRTADLIPMCHPLSLDHVELRLNWLPDDRLEILCRASCQGRTGVEMEALTGAGVAALTVVDMVKGVSKGVRIGCIELLEKTGGKSGTWRREGVEIPPEGL